MQRRLWLRINGKERGRKIMKGRRDKGEKALVENKKE